MSIQRTLSIIKPDAVVISLEMKEKRTWTRPG